MKKRKGLLLLLLCCSFSSISFLSQKEIPGFCSLTQNYEKHASRVSQVIAAVAKVSCRHGLWLIARVKKPRKVNPFRGVLSVLFLS